MIDWLAQLSDADRTRVIDEAFGKVVSTDEGKIVFAILLEELHFFRRAETAEQQALNNFAKWMIKHLFDEGAEFRVVEALLERRKRDA